MPPVLHLDPYEPCVNRKNGLYCYVEIDLVANGSSDLMHMIQEYSERKETHFNHTRLHYGICVTRTCKDYYNENTTVDIKSVIEECLNKTFWDEYELRTRINEDPACNNEEKYGEIEPVDIAVAVICLCLVILNTVGSIYDFFFVKADSKGNNLLLCFSLKRNWQKLTAPVADNQDPQIKRLKGFSGIRALSIYFVLNHHSLMPFVISQENTHFYENTYGDISFHLLYDASILVQIFFMISGCLLAYFLEMNSEKEEINWKTIPKVIVFRWLRLTPPYALVLAITVTWIRFVGSGPLWHKIIISQLEICRRDGWLNLLYLNNYIGNMNCMPHTWYLAADTQLFIMGLVILVLARSNRARKVVLAVMFIIGLIIPGLHTYYQNLNASFIITPEGAFRGFMSDLTFTTTYARGHTNMPCYILGLVLGLLTYHLQKEQFNIEKYKTKTFIYLYRAIIPLGIVLILCTGLFYMDGIEAPLLARAIYSGLFKGIFGLLMFALLFGMVFKFENTFRATFEWRAWTSPARVSYCAYLIHYIMVQTAAALRTTLIRITVLQMIFICIGTAFVSYMAAYPFWLLVEAPVSQLFKLMLTFNKNKSKSEKNIVEIQRGSTHL